MGQIKVVLIFNEDNERQKEIGTYLKSQKRCKTATDDTCRFPAYMRLYAVESCGAPETAECGRKDRKYRKEDATDICAGGRILWSQPGAARNEISQQKEHPSTRYAR